MLQRPPSYPKSQKLTLEAPVLPGFLSSRRSCLAICDDVLPVLNTRSYVAHRARNFVLFYLCISMLLPSNGESMLDPFEDMEGALLWASGTRTSPSLFILHEELVFWKPKSVGCNTCTQWLLALRSQATVQASETVHVCSANRTRMCGFSTWKQRVCQLCPSLHHGYSPFTQPPPSW